MATPADFRYSPAHAWVRVEGAEATVGITDYAQAQLGDLLYLDLPDAGEALARGEPFGVVQSFKTTADLIAPVDGEVVAANAEVLRGPKAVNGAPYGRGWLVRVRLADPAQAASLLDGPAYDAVVAAAG
ncbi:MAG TPA: glycine cleavage system protein GcvH [Thermomicrobiales bacterium]|nr:glycine cleavage system protein GcvH [Thermomicrobiales bacterium]